MRQIHVQKNAKQVVDNRDTEAYIKDVADSITTEIADDESDGEQYDYSELDKETQKLLSQNSKENQVFFDGIKFQLRFDAFELFVYSIQRDIVRNGEILPNFHFAVRNFCLKVGFVMDKLLLMISLKEIAGTDYYKEEEVSASVPWA